MPFGPTTTISIPSTTPEHVSHVMLTRFDCDPGGEGDTLFPFRRTDPTLRFLGSAEVPATRNAKGFYRMAVEEEPTRAVWGIKVDDELAGFTYLDAYNNAQSPSFAIALAERARGKRIGRIVTAGMASIAFAPGLLHEINSSFGRQIVSLETVIHPENYASQAMCEGAGYIRGRQYVDHYRGRSYPWIEYSLLRANVRVPSGITSTVDFASSRLAPVAISS